MFETPSTAMYLGLILAVLLWLLGTGALLAYWWTGKKR
jgi:hypothetical protein